MDGPLDLNDYLADPWLGRRTGRPFLDRDPDAEREALLCYLEHQTSAWLTLVSEHADALPALPAETRLFVFLIAGNESDLIERCLSALADDIVFSGLHREAEIVVVRQHCAGDVVDDTADRVRRWIRRHRDLIGVRLLEVEWPTGCRTFLALSRKLAVDVVLRRIARSPRTAPCYFITEDADVEWVERGRARAAVDTFDARPRLDALRGWHMRSLDLLEYLPFFVERVTWRAAEHALSRPELRAGRRPAYSFAWNRVVTAGWNVAFTLESYVLSGGYTPTVQLFEDMDLGQRISVMRGHRTGGTFIPSADTVEWLPYEACSDGRRGLAAILGHTDLYGTDPVLDGFITATATSRAWPRRDAAAAARRRPGPDAVEAVLDRRRQEIRAIARDDDVSDSIMRTALRELGCDDARPDLERLVNRQREFLAAARAVAAGSSSRDLSSVLRRTAA